jgi:hypothetical protein
MSYCHSLPVFGLVKCALGGMIFFSNAKAALMMLVNPDAPSECPTFGFTYNTVSIHDVEGQNLLQNGPRQYIYHWGRP